MFENKIETSISSFDETDIYVLKKTDLRQCVQTDGRKECTSYLTTGNIFNSIRKTKVLVRIPFSSG